MYTNFLQEMSYVVLLGVSAIDRPVLGGNVKWDLRMMSAVARCPL